MFNGSKELRERTEALESKVRTLREEVDTLKRQFSLDWEELQDKVHRWMQRTGARQRSEAKAGGAVQQFNALQPTMPGMDPVSARILAQRARRSIAAVPPLPTETQAVQGEGQEESA